MHTFDEYQESVKRVMGSHKTERAVYALGLAGEAGEVIDILKKHWGHGKPLDRQHLKEELGDVLWYVTALAEQFDFDLSSIAESNNAKLVKRYPNGFESGPPRPGQVFSPTFGWGPA